MASAAQANNKAAAAAAAPMKAKTNNRFYGAQILLRMLVVPTTVGAAWVMVTSSESTTLFGIHLDARYDYSSALKFYVIGNAIACVLVVISVIPVMMVRRQGGIIIGKVGETNMLLCVFVHDLVMMSLVLAGLGAATAIGYVGQHGNMHAGWIPICDNFHNFCHRVTTSLVLSYLALLLCFILTLLDVFYITTTAHTPTTPTIQP